MAKKTASKELESVKEGDFSTGTLETNAKQATKEVAVDIAKEEAKKKAHEKVEEAKDNRARGNEGGTPL